MSGARRSPRSVWTTSPVAPVDLRGLEPGVAPSSSSSHSSPVVEGGERPRQLPAERPVTARGRRDRRTSAGSTASSPRCSSHSRRRRAGGRLALADLVAVDHEHARAAWPASSRATASPAKLAPQTTTSASASSGVRSTPRLVARMGMRRRRIRSNGEALTSAPCNVSHQTRNQRQASKARRSSRAPTASCSRSTGRSSPTTTRPSSLFEEGDVVTGARRAHRQRRGPRRHRLQERGGHPLQRALDPQVRRPAR